MKRILTFFLLVCLVLSLVVLGFTSCASETGFKEPLVDIEDERQTDSESQSVTDDGGTDTQSATDDGEADTQSESESESNDENPVVVYTLEIAGGKREYYVGEEFSASGLTVTLKGGETDEVLSSEDYTVDSSGYDTLKTGEYAITVTLKTNDDLHIEYFVTVSELPDERKEDKWSRDLWL